MEVYKLPRLEVLKGGKLRVRWIFHGACQCDISWNYGEPNWKKKPTDEDPGFVCYDCLSAVMRLHRKGEKTD